MINIVYDHQVLRLTEAFYNDYPNKEYGEILKKAERPYNCLLIQTAYEYFICVPYRTEISHGYAYKFTRSKRSRRHRSGLDYTKIVIVAKQEYLDTSPALVDADEYKETMMNIERIAREAHTFVEQYVRHWNGEQVLHPSEFKRRYQFSPLKYFHKELH